MRGPIVPRSQCLPPQLERPQRGSAHAHALPSAAPVSLRAGATCPWRHVGGTGLLLCVALMASPASRKQWAAVHKAGSFCPSGQGQGDTDASLFRMLWNPGIGLSRN